MHPQTRAAHCNQAFPPNAATDAELWLLDNQQDGASTACALDDNQQDGASPASPFALSVLILGIIHWLQQTAWDMLSGLPLDRVGTTGTRDRGSKALTQGGLLPACHGHPFNLSFNNLDLEGAPFLYADSNAQCKSVMTNMGNISCHWPGMLAFYHASRPQVARAAALLCNTLPLPGLQAFLP